VECVRHAGAVADVQASRRQAKSRAGVMMSNSIVTACCRDLGMQRDKTPSSHMILAYGMHMIWGQPNANGHLVSPRRHVSGA
jgi:hypothetical protein